MTFTSFPNSLSLTVRITCRHHLLIRAAYSASCSIAIASTLPTLSAVRSSMTLPSSFPSLSWSPSAPLLFCAGIRLRLLLPQLCLCLCLAFVAFQCSSHAFFLESLQQNVLATSSEHPAPVTKDIHSSCPKFNFFVQTSWPLVVDPNSR